jgi:hypothetical protein
MHQLIKDHLEEYLRDTGTGKVPPEFRSHLASCKACAQETELLAAQGLLFRSALAVNDAEPSPGFYARVMNRVEEERRDESIWAVLLEPAFGRRLAIACGTLALLLGTYMASTERAEHPMTPSGVVMSDDRNSTVDNGSAAPGQRDAVLVNLVTYRD